MEIQDINQDWDNVKKRWVAWWNQELYDRALVVVGSARDGVMPQEQQEVDLETYWTDVDGMIRRTLETVRTTYYGGEYLPIFSHLWAVGHAVLFGCKPHYRPDTIWVDPAPVGDDGFPNLDGWRDSPWWDWMLRSTSAAAQACRGRYFIWTGWGNHAGDTLALVRGTEQFLMDIATNPEWVKSAVKKMSDILIEVFEELWNLASAQVTGVEGSLNYVSNWSPGRTMGFDCDMACMVSPETFEEIFLPPLQETMRLADHRMWHLDGIGNFKHLDALLEVSQLHAVQIGPGDGNPGVLHWIHLIRRIQAKGKSVIVSVAPSEIQPLMEQVQPEGLCIGTWAGSEAEAREIVDLVGELTRRRNW